MFDVRLFSFLLLNKNNITLTCSRLDDKQVVFGKVIEGMNVVNELMVHV